MLPTRKWCQPRPSQKFGSFMATPKMESLPTACCVSTILTKVWTSRSRWIFFVFVCWHSANANYLIIPDIIPNYYPDSPAEKLSVTEMLQKRMREEEMAKEKPKKRRRSSVFKEHEESRARVCELRAAPGCTTVSWPTRSNFQFYPTLPRSSLLWLLPVWAYARVFSTAGNTVIVRCNLRLLK